MTEHHNAIQIDNATGLTDQSYEIARIWVTQGGGSTAWIASNVLIDPRAFGRLIAELMDHGSRAYVMPGRTEAESMAAIKDGFEIAMRSRFGVEIDVPSGEESK